MRRPGPQSDRTDLLPRRISPTNILEIYLQTRPFANPIVRFYLNSWSIVGTLVTTVSSAAIAIVVHDIIDLFEVVEYECNWFPVGRQQLSLTSVHNNFRSNRLWSSSASALLRRVPVVNFNFAGYNQNSDETSLKRQLITYVAACKGRNGIMHYAH